MSFPYWQQHICQARPQERSKEKLLVRGLDSAHQLHSAVCTSDKGQWSLDEWSTSWMNVYTLKWMKDKQSKWGSLPLEWYFGWWVVTLVRGGGETGGYVQVLRGWRRPPSHSYLRPARPPPSFKVRFLDIFKRESFSFLSQWIRVTHWLEPVCTSPPVLSPFKLSGVTERSARPAGRAPSNYFFFFSSPPGKKKLCYLPGSKFANLATALLLDWLSFHPFNCLDLWVIGLMNDILSLNHPSLSLVTRMTARKSARPCPS
jgi:hypothetical protein